MGAYCKRLILFIFLFFLSRATAEVNDLKTFVDENVLGPGGFVYWPNGTIPFYVDENNFDEEQTNTILLALKDIEHKSCLKFTAVPVYPEGNRHVMTFQNPKGLKKCEVSHVGHSIDKPHYVDLGYECLRTPWLEMQILKALGFYFEHTRHNRDEYIDIQSENVETGHHPLFLKEMKLPPELDRLPYDLHSVMHFGERDFSRNGHRTIMIKDSNVKQKREGLSDIDLRKIEIIYGPECRKRERQNKIEECKKYGKVRRKRSAEEKRLHKSLRVNPDITPPPEIVKDTTKVSNNLKEMGIENEVENVVDHIYKVSAKALENARAKFCNITVSGRRTGNETVANATVEKKILDDVLANITVEKSPDILGIIEAIAKYVQSMVDHATGNLTEFCLQSKSMEAYQRQQCMNSNNPRCHRTYFSTKSGRVMYSTQHRPWVIQSTKHKGGPMTRGNIYHPIYRAGNESDITTPSLEPAKSETEKTHRKKREVTKDVDIAPLDKVNNLNASAVNTPTQGIVNNAVDNATFRRKHRSTEDSVESELPKKYRGKIKEIKLQKKYDSNDYENSYKQKSHKKRLEEEESEKELNHKKRDREESYERKRDRKESNERKRYKKESNERKRYKKESNERDSDRKESNEKDRDRKESNEKDRDRKESNERDRDRTESNERKRDKKELSKRKPESEEINKRKKDKDETNEAVNERVRDIKHSDEYSTDKFVRLSKKNEEFYAERRWHDGIVPYIIADEQKYDLEDLRNRLDEVNHILKKKTCVRLQEISEDDTKNYKDFIVLDSSPDYVTGRVGGRQSFGAIELFEGGQHRQHAAMMVMAMLGFYFELARHDRDKFIRVHMRNIRANKLHHFEKMTDDATLGLPYDYKSAMHPSWQFWRKVGKTGIASVATFTQQDPNGKVMKSLGQNEELLSDTDITKINSVYGTKCFQNKRRSKKV